MNFKPLCCIHSQQNTWKQPESKKTKEKIQGFITDVFLDQDKQHNHVFFLTSGQVKKSYWNPVLTGRAEEYWLNSSALWTKRLKEI